MSFVYWVPNSGGDWDTPSNWSGGVLPGRNDNVTISTTSFSTITHSTGTDIIASLTVGNDLLDITGGALVVSGAISMANGYTQTGGAFIAQGTVSIAGTTQLLGGLLGGNAQFQSTGTITLSNYTIAGNAQLLNASTVNQTGNVTLSSSVPSIVNEAGSVFDITAGNLNIYNGSTPVSTFTNAGTLEMTATSGTSFVRTNLSSTGIISAAAGSYLEIDGPSNTISGTIAGAGQVQFGTGMTTIAANTAISVAGLAVYTNITNSSTATYLTFAGAETLGGNLSVTNGPAVLTLGGNTTVDGNYSQNDNSSLLLSGYTLTVDGNATFASYYNTPTLGGTGTLATMGTTTLNTGGTALVIGGSVSWANYGTVSQNANFYVGNASGFTASVVNKAGGVFNIAAGNINVYNGSTPVSTFTNAGTLEMTAASGTSYIRTDLSSTGTVSANSGDYLEIDGPVNTISGSIAGGGQVQFGSGTTTIGRGTTISVASLAVYTNVTNSSTNTYLTFAGAETIGGNLSVTNGPAVITLGGNTVVNGNFSQNDNSFVSLGSYTLTVDGNATFADYYNTPTVGGTGTLATKGTTTLNSGGTALVIGGSTTWANYGTVNQNANINVGNAAGFSASVVNKVGGVFNIAAGNINIYNGSTPVSTFTNAGTLEMTATNNVTSRIYTDLASTGAISAVAGSYLEIDGPSNTISGTISGAGQVQLGTGTTTIAANTAISVASLAVYTNVTNSAVSTYLTFAGAETIGGNLSVTNGPAVLTLGGNATVDGNYTQNDNSFLSLGGYTLTVDGSATFADYYNTPTVGGTGTLATMGTTTLNSGGTALVIGGSTTWANYGTVNQNANFYVGTSGGLVASLVNEAGGVFDIDVGNINIYNGSTPASTFTNAGTLQMTAASGTSYVGTDLSSTGAISVNSGDYLEIDGPVNTIAGSIAGAGQVQFGAGTSTLAAGTAITVGTLAVYHNGTTLALGGNVTVSGGFSMGYGSVLNLSGQTLTLAGPASFYQNSQTPLIAGPGRLVTDGATSLTGGAPALVLGSTATWENAGTVTESQTIQIGNSTTASAALINDAGAIFNIGGGNIAINNGPQGLNFPPPASTFTNAGTLEMTATNNTTSHIYTDLTSTGTIMAVAGSNLEIEGPSNTVSGTITGTGEVSFGNGGSTTIAFGTVINIATLAVYGSLTTLGIAGNITVSGGFSDSGGTTLSLGSHVLTLAGAATFTQSSGSPLVSGTGTLVTKGATGFGGGGIGLVVGSAVTWNNYGMVTDSQTLQFGSSGGGSATLANERAGVFDIVTNGVSLTNGGSLASSLSNIGLFEMTAIGGSASVAATVTNTGTILAQGGNLSVSGAVTGTGLLELQSGGTLSLTNTVQSTETLKFLDTTGRLNLTLPSPTAFAAEITNFAPGDTIDLTNITNAAATFSGGVLTFISNSTEQTVAVLNFTGSPNFSYSSDGHGGTLITDTAAAHAPLGASSESAMLSGISAIPNDALLNDLIPGTHSGAGQASAASNPVSTTLLPTADYGIADTLHSVIQPVIQLPHAPEVFHSAQ